MVIVTSEGGRNTERCCQFDGHFAGPVYVLIRDAGVVPVRVFSGCSCDCDHFDTLSSVLVSS